MTQASDINALAEAAHKAALEIVKEQALPGDFEERCRLARLAEQALEAAINALRDAALAAIHQAAAPAVQQPHGDLAVPPVEAPAFSDEVAYPRDWFDALISGNSPYAFYLFQWVPYQTEAKRWRLKMKHDVRTFDGREAFGIWPNGNSCGPFKDHEVEFIRISRKQWGEEWADQRPAVEPRSTTDPWTDDYRDWLRAGGPAAGAQVAPAAVVRADKTGALQIYSAKYNLRLATFDPGVDEATRLRIGAALAAEPVKRQEPAADEHEAFAAWKADGAKRCHGGRYSPSAWEAWQGRAALAVKPQPFTPAELVRMNEPGFGHIAGVKPQEPAALLDEWAAAAGVHFVSRSYGQYTTTTVARDDLMQLVRAATQAEPQEKQPEQAGPFFVGNWYRTQGGDLVRICGVANKGARGETVFDQHGCHRYTQASHLAGRVTGSAHDFSHPDNIAATQADPVPGMVLPKASTPEASAMMDSLLAEYQWPANPKNAARAGWEAASRFLAASPKAVKPSPAQ